MIVPHSVTALEMILGQFPQVGELKQGPVKNLGEAVTMPPGRFI